MLVQMVDGQTKVGYWRDHLPYKISEKVISTDDKVYCLANSNLFYYNKFDGSLNKLNKISGLSDIDVTAIEYHKDLEMLIIGYANGNIDLLDKEGVFNVSAIERKPIPGSKRINNIFITDSSAYISTDFAIVILNLDKKEIKDTYYVGENGEKTQIIDITIDAQNIYALQKDKILVANRYSPFLIDFNQWVPYFPITDDTSQYRNIEKFGNDIYVSMEINGYKNDILYKINGNELEPVNLGFEADYYNLKAKEDELIISRTWLTVVYDHDLNKLKQFNAGTPYDGDMDSDNTGWIASYSGLIRISGYDRDTIYPDGPKNNGVYDFDYSNGTMWVAGGTPSLYWSRYGVHYFEDEKWKTIDYVVDTGLSSVLNISFIKVDPKDPNHVFGASNSSGLVEFRNKKVVKVYNEYNSILRPTDGHENEINDPIYLRITGMDFDSKGNLYLVVTESTNPLYVLTPEGELYNLEYDLKDFGVHTYIWDLMVTSNDQVWVLMKQRGLFIFDINKTPGNIEDDRMKRMNAMNQNGDIRNDVVSIAEDLDKNIWVGTGEGPLVYFDHGRFLDDDYIRSTQAGQQVILSEEDGIYDYLLVSEKILSIAIDGANRKWLGTQSSGVHLISEDGNKQILNFREDNSPLYSNEVVAIGIDDQTGEVFFGTSKGIITYRGEATKGQSSFGKVYVFPNPVKHDYRDNITITGLANNVNVKITDISGNLVYETTALGGQAIWNGDNFDGKRVHTGVYLVFCTNSDGTETFVTKMVFIH